MINSSIAENLGCIIQARMGSTRLPGKVMRKVDEQNPLMFYVLSQIKYCKKLKKIIVATTTKSEDDQIIEFLKKNNVNYFRGSSDDVLDRYYQCAKKFKLSIIIRITCDNPLIDPTILDEMIPKFDSEKYDYMTNSMPRTFPSGNEIEIFSFSALKKAWIEAKKHSEREHVTPYFYNNLDKFRIFIIKNSEDLSKFRWTVDHENDLVLVKKIISKIKKRPILMNDILNLMKNEPSLFTINENNIINEGYIKSLKEDIA